MTENQEKKAKKVKEGAAKRILDENLNIIEVKEETARLTLELSKETVDAFNKLTTELDMRKKDLADILLNYAIANIKTNEVEVKEEK